MPCTCRPCRRCRLLRESITKIETPQARFPRLTQRAASAPARIRRNLAGVASSRGALIAWPFASRISTRRNQHQMRARALVWAAYRCQGAFACVRARGAPIDYPPTWTTPEPWDNPRHALAPRYTATQRITAVCLRAARQALAQHAQKRTHHHRAVKRSNVTREKNLARCPLGQPSGRNGFLARGCLGVYANSLPRHVKAMSRDERQTAADTPSPFRPIPSQFLGRSTQPHRAGSCWASPLAEPLAGRSRRSSPGCARQRPPPSQG